MGAWYWIGVAAGLGAAAGVLFAGAIRVALLAIAVAVAAGAALGYGIDAWQPGSWVDVVAGALAGGVAALGAVQVVSGALRRGGTALIVAGAALVAAALAWVPALGYLVALSLPVLAARLHRRAPERYAGLRTLARD